MRKEKEFNQEKDYAIREAVCRQAHKKPTMPSDLNQRVMARMNQGPRTILKRRIWIAAACVAVAVIVTLLFVNNNHGTSIPNESLTAQGSVNNQPQTQTNDAVNTITPSAPEAITNNIPTPRKVQKTQRSIKDKPVDKEEVASIIEEPTHEEYADAEPITPPIQKVVNPTNYDPHALTPDNMDRMIAQMAAYYKVQGLELNCSNNDDFMNGTMYVLPDDEDIDIIGRLYATLLRFDTSAPNIQLMCSSEQFFFCMTNERDGKTTEDYWMAERSRGRIYLYRTQSTADEPVSSACFFEYVAKHDRKHSNYS
ncbi:MAG: hypothetical protein J5770_06490 [Bacteroidaceae bacterium]|nr:hypothetical protein [Bacteroidaceae bacterium]